MRQLIIIFIVLLSLSFPSCKKYLDPGPPSTQLTGETVFKNDATAIAAQLSIYSEMEATGLAYSMIVYLGIAGDENANYWTFTQDYLDIASNNLTPNNELVSGMWNAFYKYIYQSNAMLEGIAGSTTLSTPVKKQLEGEALFVRAFSHFYLINLFGYIPLVTATDYQSNALASQSDSAVIYNAIISDLVRSKDLLTANYVGSKNEVSIDRVRPNKFAASALLARVYLYTGQWDKAQAEAGFVLANTTLYHLEPDLSKVFLKNSPEAVWQWMAVLPNFNTYVGGFLPTTGFPYIVTLSSGLVSRLQTSDNRKAAWTNIFDGGTEKFVFPYKYKAGQGTGSITEYTMVLRLAEQYLIRAEASAQLSNLAASLADLNTIRQRAGLPDTTITNQPDLLNAIGDERRLEFFGEFGDRWIDLKRTGKIDPILSQLKGTDWSPTDKLFPIPQTELDRNPQLHQNAGY